MTKLKQIFALLLAIFMMFVLLTACSEGASEKEEEETEKPLLGYEFTILQGNDSSEFLFYFWTDTPLGDKMHDHIAYVENKTGCHISFLGGQGESSLITQVTTGISAGANVAETIRMHGNNCLMTFARAGILLPMSQFPDTIDYLHSDKYGYPAQFEAALVENEVYAICPTRWPMHEMEVDAQVVVFNNGMLQALDIGDLREVKENGEWYWDKFLEVISAATHDEGGRSVKGFCGFANQITRLAMLSNGVGFIARDGESIGTDIYSSKCIHAVEFVQSLYSDYKNCVMQNSSGSVWNIEDFLNEDAALQMVHGQYVTGGSLQYDSNIDFGFLPFPCGPEGTYGEWAHSLEAIFGFAIPTTADMPDYAAIALDVLFDPLQDYADMTKEEYYAANIFKDARDAKTYVEIASGGRYTYWLEGGSTFINNIATNINTKSAAQLIEAYGPSYETVIEEYMMPNYDFISQYILK